MTVVDASALIELLLSRPLGRAAERYVFGSADGCAAPDLVNSEVLQYLRGHERGGRIEEPRSREAVDDLLALPIARYPTLPLLDRAWALRHNFTAYDAMYVALAEALETPLVTADEHLARAVDDHADVEAVLLSLE